MLLAVDTTPGRFASKARRARGSLFPDSCDARTKQAFRGRSLSVDPGKDGMSWVTLHVPTIAAKAIFVHYTRSARAIKAAASEAQRAATAAGTGKDCREPQTMDQMRADIAAILLMGQELPSTANYAPPQTSSRTSSSNGCGTGNGSDSVGGKGNARCYGSGTDNGSGFGYNGGGSAFFPDTTSATSGTCWAVDRNDKWRLFRSSERHPRARKSKVRGTGFRRSDIFTGYQQLSVRNLRRVSSFDISGLEQGQTDRPLCQGHKKRKVTRSNNNPAVV